jgi:hypothetical protein
MKVTNGASLFRRCHALVEAKIFFPEVCDCIQLFQAQKDNLGAGPRRFIGNAV